MIKNNVRALYRTLKREGHFLEAKMVQLLYILANYDDEWRSRIDGLARGKEYPFAHWFPEGQNRLIIDFIRQDIDMPFQVEDIIKKYNIQIEDYLKGYALDQYGRRSKLTKILNRLIKDFSRQLQSEELDDSQRQQLELNIEELRGAWQAFQSDPNRVAKSDNQLAIVISQDPHDIAQASFNRSWESCFRIGPDDESSEAGAHAQTTLCEVREGGLVAYLIRASDTNINDPLARILIRRFKNQAGKNIALSEQSVYGDDVPGFQEAVDKFLESKNGELTPGAYNRIGGPYSDTFSGMEEIIAPKNVQDIVKWLQKDIPEPTERTKWRVTDNHYDELSEAGYFKYDNPFDDRIRFRGGGGWGYDDYEELDDDDDVEGEKLFDTEEEAISFLDSLRHHDDAEEYTRIMLHNEGEDPDDMDPEEFWEKHEEYSSERFELEREDEDKLVNYQQAAVTQALKMLNQLPPEVLDLMEEFIDENYKRRTSWDHDARRFYMALPNRLTAEEFILLGPHWGSHILQGKDATDAKVGELSDEKRAEFTQAAINNADQRMTLDSNEVTRELYKDIDLRDMHLSRQEKISDRYSVRVTNLMHSATTWFDQLYPKVEEIFHRLMDEVDSKDKILRKDKDKIYVSALGRVRSLAGFENLQAIHRMLSRMMPHFNPEVTARGSNQNINLLNIGYEVSLLGRDPELAKEYIPVFQDLVDNFEDYAMASATEQTKYNPSYKDQAYQNALKSKEKALYVLDSLTNGTGRSEKYKWFG